MRVARTYASNQIECGQGEEQAPDIEFAFAFQPIVSVGDQTIFAHEALIRGPQGQSAMSVLSQGTWNSRHRFDQRCRNRAIEQAVALGMREPLSLNFIPNDVASQRACIHQTLRFATENGFDCSRLIFELTESEKVVEAESLCRVFREYRELGVRTAIDDFGAGYAGLNLLARFQPDIVKIDMDLVRGVESDKTKQIIVESIVGLCEKLGIVPLAEGVETAGERDTLSGLGIDLMQGYLFARPAFNAIAAANPAAWCRR